MKIPSDPDPFLRTVLPALIIFTAMSVGHAGEVTCLGREIPSSPDWLGDDSNSYAVEVVLRRVTIRR